MSSLRKALGMARPAPGISRTWRARAIASSRTITRELCAATPARIAQFPDAARKRTGLPPRLAPHDRPRRDRAGHRRRSHCGTIRHHHRPRRHGQDDGGDRSRACDAGGVQRRGVFRRHRRGRRIQTLVAATIASSLGLAMQTADAVPTLLEYFRAQRILLVLDNCEHVVDAVATSAGDDVQPGLRRSHSRDQPRSAARRGRARLLAAAARKPRSRVEPEGRRRPALIPRSSYSWSAPRPRAAASS